jgi:hypothetical protein
MLPMGMSQSIFINHDRYPSRKTISDLIYKRGYAKIGKERIPITSNEIVEKHLGDAGIICVEDLVHELATCGDNFKEANSFVWYRLFWI